MSFSIGGGGPKDVVRDPFKPEDRTRFSQLSDILFGRLGFDEQVLGGKAPNRQLGYTGTFQPVTFGPLNLGTGVPPELRSALSGLFALNPAAQGAFNRGLQLATKTAKGAFLDVTKVPAFQRLADALRTTAAQEFQDLLDTIRSDAARKGIYSSSARLNQENLAAARVANQIAESLARAGFEQYGAERGYQEGAGAALRGLLPQLLGLEAETALNTGQLGLRGAGLELERQRLGEAATQARLGQLLDLLGLARGVTTRKPGMQWGFSLEPKDLSGLGGKTG
jgi:hypothetical protein